MASTYVNDLRLNEMATGDGSGTWGTTTNTNLELIGEALGYGTEGITTNADTHTSTIADGATDPVRAMYVKYTGTLDSACTITIAPNTINRMQFIENGTSGSQNIIISQGSGANVTIPPGDTKAVYLDGAGSGAAVVDAFASLSVVDLKVQDDLTITDDLTFSSDSAVVTFGADGDTTLTHTDGTGLTLNSTNKICFNDASQFIQGSSATVLSLGATDEIDLTATAVDLNGTLDVSGTLTQGGASQFNSTITVGVDDTGYDVKFFGATASAYMLWDESDDDLILAGAARVVVPASGLVIGSTAVSSTAAELNLLDALDRGSILYGNSSGATAVLGQGSADQVLTSDGTDISWADASGGATSINGLSDAKTFGTSSIMLGDATTGTIDAANYNVGLGVDVFAALTTGDSNIAIGFSSANDLTTGSNNVSIGAYALDVATTESGQTAVGYQALTANDTNGGNTAIGYQAGSGITSGASNICIGYQAYDKGTTGYDTIAIGNNCLDNGSAYTGYYNTFVGNGAARLITSAINNTALGKSALAAETTGSTNTAVGYAALTAQDTGFSNTAVGSSAGTAVTTGDENCFLGDSAGLQNTSGSRNVAIGYRGFRGNSSGSDCIIIGSDASYTNCTGSKNIAIGNNAGYNWTTAYNNTVIGYNARTDEYNSYGAVTIGYNGVGYASEHVTFVNGSNKTYVSIGSTSWGGTSDQRLKENVQTSTAGLSFINDLRPVTFDWKKKKDIDNSLEGYEEDSDDRYIKNNPTNRHGFVAQEVKTALDNHSEVLSGNEIWSEAKDGTQGISEVALIPMLVKALQEADDKIDALTTRIETLEG
jgi:hypothetical protein